MTLTSKEHYDLMAQFEREFSHRRVEKEADKARWAKGNVYQDGTVNELFLAYRRGYSFGIAA